MSAVEVHRVVKAPRGRARTERSVAHDHLLVRPLASPDCPIDVTEALTRAIAHELWRNQGGNAVLNWLEAERAVSDLLGRVRSSVASDRVPLAHSMIESKPAADRVDAQLRIAA